MSGRPSSGKDDGEAEKLSGPETQVALPDSCRPSVRDCSGPGPALTPHPFTPGCVALDLDTSPDGRGPGPQRLGPSLLQAEPDGPGTELWVRRTSGRDPESKGRLFSEGGAFRDGGVVGTFHSHTFSHSTVREKNNTPPTPTPAGPLVRTWKRVLEPFHTSHSE